MDLRDYFVLAVLTNLVGAATVYLFIHPSDIAFGTWGTILATTVSGFHWMVIRDSKEKDAC